MTAGTDPITKLGTEVVGVRAVSGFIRHDQPDQLILRQLYPGKPANIGGIDLTGADQGRVTIHPDCQGEWSDHDRAALAAFFMPRFRERLDG
jgi:hypothetical protein